MSKEAMKLALEAAYLAGFNASGEGYNAEYPFGDHARNPEEDAVWIKDRDNALQEALAEQPAQQQEPFGYFKAEPFGWTDCAETDEGAIALYEHPQPTQQQKPVTPCTHPNLGICSLREDGTASRWGCVMCGTEFVPKATQRWAEFNETTKRNIKHAEWYLSAHPQPVQPSKPWVGLTDEEMQDLWDRYAHMEMMRAIEAKLKEKNA